MPKNLAPVFLSASALLLASCAAPRLPPDARGVSFPEPASSYMVEGTPVHPDTVRLIQPGQTKAQVRQLLGNPHFSEGVFSVEDWNYLLNLPRLPAGSQQCQLQVQFDEGGKVKASYWRTDDCARQVAGDATAEASQVSAAAPGAAMDLSLQPFLFPFARSEVGALAPDDRRRLDSLAAELSGNADAVSKVEVIGHADRIGSPARKHLRSLDRARGIAAVLEAQGVDPQKIEVVAKGDAETVSACNGSMTLPALKACLAPDRRVEVRAQSVK